jgi:hypothetical protein
MLLVMIRLCIWSGPKENKSHSEFELKTCRFSQISKIALSQLARAKLTSNHVYSAEYRGEAADVGGIKVVRIRFTFREGRDAREFDREASER